MTLERHARNGDVLAITAPCMLLTNILAKGIRWESLGHTFKLTAICTLVMVLPKDSAKETASTTNEVLLYLSSCLSMRYPSTVRSRLRNDDVYIWDTANEIATAVHRFERKNCRE